MLKKLLLLVVPVSLLVSACGGRTGGDVVAAVGDAEITVADVESVPYEAAGAIPQDEFADYLTALIQWEILESAAADEFGIEPSDEDVEAELERFLEIQAGGMGLGELAETQNISEDALRRAMRSQVIQREVAVALGEQAEAPSDQEVAESMREVQVGATEVCVRHVLVQTAAEAEEVRDRLEDGELFETVAAETSTDTGTAENGGDLGCAPAGSYVPEFRDAAVNAEIDAITEPVETSFGFHVLQVYERTDPAAEELPSEEQVRQRLLDNAGFEALQTWALDKMEEAEVTVEEEYGTWVTDTEPRVEPPVD